MIRANWLNWPWAFTSAFLFGGGLIAMSESKERRFWGGVALAWALTVSGLSMRNGTLVDPVQEKIGVELAVNVAKHAAAGHTELVLHDLESKLGKKEKERDADKARYSDAKKNRPAAMAASGAAVRAAERERDSARDAWLQARSDWQAVKHSDPSRWKAEALVFLLSTLVNGSASIFIGKYLGSRDAPHNEALHAVRARRRLRHSVKALARSRKGQEGRARLILARLRAAYMTKLEASGRLSATEIKTMTERAFGKTAEDAGAIVETAVTGYREAIRPRWRGGWWGSERARPAARG